VARILILSGGGEFADPWHPFAETSEALGELLGSIGHEVEIDDAVEQRAQDLSDVDVLVTNAADGPVGPARSAAYDGIAAYLARGGSVFALHVGAATLLGMPEWETVTGMAWIDGSWHPPLGPSQMRVDPLAHPIAAGTADFELIDERYSDLRLGGDSAAFVTHELDGASHPVMWARQHGTSRVVVDTMGHDIRSFESAEHRRLIERSFAWLLNELDG